ncbi:MAG: hypothetical protein M3M96_05420 [Candidatus Eremiobacteraeota bacterium]|nr:hypothetical protein [Candidatus Eremiobacteraeota bacterium]
MTLLRGKGMRLEVALIERDVDEALTELESRLSGRGDFYRGTAATAAFGEDAPSGDQLGRLQALLDANGITLQAISGGASVRALAEAAGLEYEAGRFDDGGQELARRRAMRPRSAVQLSEAARSLVADFAGARSDIAERRKRGEQSVRPLVLSYAVESATSQTSLQLVEPGPSTLYHTGTLRGGQSLHNVGNIVVVGDVNPGAELVATGDIVVFGSLRGVAHAGAQGATSARVSAIDLAPTQLRIAALIAADFGDRKRTGIRPEAACVQGDRIAIVPHDQFDSVPREGIT